MASIPLVEVSGNCALIQYWLYKRFLYRLLWPPHDSKDFYGHLSSLTAKIKSREFQLERLIPVFRAIILRQPDEGIRARVYMMFL
ncbi:hypothetical protein EYZ11_007372 [Aspergillus tanneri]|uniref:Uncharacterized protein n=1 Tax=Aspergillus tanneri TaxID=1220188 RepID=A0A4S3JD59_9EURO|nr:hypothetical protein EYZ11_007372 [Aspergillus tanneri]